MPGRLIVLAGLPGAGKSSLAREIARRLGAVWLRVDTMDQAIWASGTAPEDLQDWTYRAAAAAAADNLALGLTVVADCVNDWTEARDGWQAAGARAGAEVQWLEVVCSDLGEHRRRVETRVSDIAGFKLPDWAAVEGRAYHGWDRARVTVDTAGRELGECVDEAMAARLPFSPCGRRCRRRRRMRGVGAAPMTGHRRPGGGARPLIRRFAPPSPTRGEGCVCVVQSPT